jgi:hypothetical protein
MITQCPNCRAKFKAHDELRGRVATCPGCKEAFSIENLQEQTVLKGQQSAMVANEIRVRCRSCQKTYAPGLRSNKSWICPNCQSVNPNLKRHYRSVADVCILGFIAGVLLLYAGLVQGRTGLVWILLLVDAQLLLVTTILTYMSRAPWADKSVKVMIVVVFGIAAVVNIGFFGAISWMIGLLAAGLYAIIWAFLLWLWIQTKRCTALP